MLNFITPVKAVIAGIALAGGLLLWHLWGELQEANKTIGQKQEEIRTLEGDLIAAAESIRKQQKTLSSLQEISRERADRNTELEGKVSDLDGRLKLLAGEAITAGETEKQEGSDDEQVCNFYSDDVPGGFINLLRDATQAANGNRDQGGTDASGS